MATTSPPLTQHQCSPLAWAGWQLDMPDEWRPLKLAGNLEKGFMIVGDAECALFSIHWERPKSGTILDPQSWVAERLSRQGLLPDGDPPAAHNFSACVWAHGVQTEEDKQTAYWYAYADEAELLIGIKINGVLTPEQLDQVIYDVLPSLQAFPLFADTTWAMYDLSFVIPAGFDFVKRHLYAGDLALEFHRGRTESLMVRQVYPGDLALARRSFEVWLANYPFKEHRRLRKITLSTEPWHHRRRSELTGLRRTGRKKLAFPLGACAPRWSHALIAHDHNLDRLLIAEHLTTTPNDGVLCEQAILGMNEFLRQRS